MKYLSLCLTALLGLVLFSCKYAYKDELITVNNEFTMTVPDYLSKCDAVKEGATFQYCNHFRNTYVVVFSDKKDKDFQTYYNEQTAIIKKALYKPMVNDSEAVTISGAKAIHTEIAGKMNDELIYYSLLTIETPTKYYMDCVWTRGEERKLKYGKDIERILYSFKLLDKK